MKKIERTLAYICGLTGFFYILAAAIWGNSWDKIPAAFRNIIMSSRVGPLECGITLLIVFIIVMVRQRRGK
jgi:hypothetical protein